MNHSDFRIGLVFWSADRPHRPWRCTDIGTRVIVAIQFDYLLDLSTGEYTVADPFYDDLAGLIESVFQEHELEHCSIARAERLTPSLMTRCAEIGPAPAAAAPIAAVTEQGSLF